MIRIVRNDRFHLFLTRLLFFGSTETFARPAKAKGQLTAVRQIFLLVWHVYSARVNFQPNSGRGNERTPQHSKDRRCVITFTLVKGSTYSPASAQPFSECLSAYRVQRTYHTGGGYVALLQKACVCKPLLRLSSSLSSLQRIT